MNLLVLEKGYSQYDTDVSYNHQVKTKVGCKDSLSERANIMIVGEDKDFTDYLFEYLSPYYSIKVFSSGLDVLEDIMNRHPDLLICDSCLTDMDGDELVFRLKTSTVTSHIPVILLGSYVDECWRRKRRHSLADSYMLKPLYPEDLKTEVTLLIRNYQVLRKYFIGLILGINLLGISFDNPQDTHSRLISDVRKFILDNISNEGLKVKQIARAVGMSKTAFFNKWKDITGHAPKYFIHSLRMEKARALLETSQYRVSEIPEMIGLNDIKNFSRKYYKYFMESPQETIRKAHAISGNNDFKTFLNPDND